MRDLFLQRADETRPRLHERVLRPVGEVAVERAAADFQGWRMVPVEAGEPWHERWYNQPCAFILDFGEHLVGHVSLRLEAEGAIDAPVRLKLIFGEMPCELAEPLDPFDGGLSRGWLQDEVITVQPPTEVTIPRRLAFRYVRLETVRPSGNYRLRFAEVKGTAVSAADVTSASPYRGPRDLEAIDAIGLRTLANCMQDVFEDGPKRDRRLWLGDLRLQALANQVTYREFGLVRRCLYLLAAHASEDELMPSDIFMHPAPTRGGNTILDYALLFAPTLLEYAEASGDWEAARELWPVARRQVDLVVGRHFDSQGLFVDPGAYWIFIDWRDGLHKEAAVQGVAICALRALLALAERLGLQGDVPDAAGSLARLARAAREKLRDPATGLFLSGPERQVSWASQAWLILAGVVSPEEGGEILDRLRETPGVVAPAGPYLYHYAVEAMFRCGRADDALDLMRRYWGGMARAGASTFWEVYDPADPALSPYQDIHLNSYCHAWSCTPSYFLRTYAAAAS